MVVFSFMALIWIWLLHFVVHLERKRCMNMVTCLIMIILIVDLIREQNKKSTKSLLQINKSQKQKSQIKRIIGSFLLFLLCSKLSKESSSFEKVSDTNLSAKL